MAVGNGAAQCDLALCLNAVDLGVTVIVIVIVIVIAIVVVVVIAAAAVTDVSIAGCSR